MHDVPTREAVSTAVAGIVSLVPEGLVLLASLVFAVAAARVGRRGALVQRLPAVEALAGLDVVCLDKTGTLTDGTLAVEEILPVSGGATSATCTRCSARSRRASAAATRRRTRCTPSSAGRRGPVPLEVPFSSRWKWSGIAFDDGTELVLGAPEVHRAARTPIRRSRTRSRVRQDRRLRVLLFARTSGLVEPEGDERAAPPARSRRSRCVALSERMRPDAATTVAYLHRTGVHVKIISGDGPATVAAVARAAGHRDRRARDDRGRAAAGRPARCGAARSTTPSSRASSPSTSASSWRRCDAAAGASA